MKNLKKELKEEERGRKTFLFFPHFLFSFIPSGLS